jgi:hypothetical protein
MTLREFFDYLGAHPTVLLAYFLAIPLMALLAGQLGKGEGHRAPWNVFYAILVFGVCIPGIFSVALSVYQFLFERGSLMNTNILLQVLPVISMLLTLSLIRRNTPFEYIPGFGRISSLMLLIGSIFMLMYLLDRTRIIAFVNIPVQYLLLIVVGLLLVFRYGLRSLLA